MSLDPARSAPIARAFRIVGVLTGALALALAPSPARAQQYYRPPPEGYYTDDRVRFTIEGALGGILDGEGAIGGGTAIAIGLQMNDIVAVYALHRLTLAKPFGDGAGGTFALSTNAAVMEATVFDRLQIAAGPSVDVGVGGLCEGDASGCEGIGDLRLGLETRIALVLGERSPARRRGLSIALSVHPTWRDREQTVTTITLAVGFTLF